jgi:hypothetical protein
MSSWGNFGFDLFASYQTRKYSESAKVKLEMLKSRTPVHFMAESTTLKISFTHSNDAPSDSERPLKKPRLDQQEPESDADDEGPVGQTEEIKASDLYLDTASAVTVFVSQC